MGHFVAMGPLTFLNLNISTIWVRDPWVTIQINKAQELAKSKISKLPITQSQPAGPPTITNSPVGLAAQSSMEGKPARKHTQQYADWDTHEYMSSKDRRQK